MTSQQNVWMAMIAVAIIAAGAYLFPHSNGVLAGGVGTRFPNGVSANNTSPVAGQLLGTTLTVTGASTFSGAAALNALATFSAGILYSFPNATTTAGATETLVVADVANYDTVLLSPNVAGNTTLTLFASSTASTWLPTAGNRQRTCFVNATTTANTNYIFAGGTGTKLIVASSTISAIGSPQIGPQKMGCFEFVRAPATATTFDILSAYTAFQ